jgi:hypothetical protein
MMEEMENKVHLEKMVFQVQLVPKEKLEFLVSLD